MTSIKLYETEQRYFDAAAGLTGHNVPCYHVMHIADFYLHKLRLEVNK